jgi:hypothetical protein
MNEASTVMDSHKDRTACFRDRSLSRKRNYVHHYKCEPLPRGSVGNLQSASPLRGWSHDKISNRFADKYYIALTLRQEKDSC